MHLYSKKWIQLCFILPILIIFAIYLIYPIGSTLAFSLCKVPSFSMESPTFIGVKNFGKLIKDEVFWVSLRNTVICVVGELVLMVPFGLLLGLLINSKFRGNSIVRVTTYTPVILSGIMCALVWSFILDPGFGLVNSFLRLVGLGAWQPLWIGGQTLTPYSVALVDSWKGVGYYAVLYMSGMKMMPESVFEASKLDGASNWQTLRYVTIPMLRETTTVAVLMITINAINAYASVYMLTSGGPNNRSQVLATYLYQTQFSDHNIGYGAAIAAAMFLLVMGFSIVYLRFNSKQVDE